VEMLPIPFRKEAKHSEEYDEHDKDFDFIGTCSCISGNVVQTLSNTRGDPFYHVAPF